MGSIKNIRIFLLVVFLLTGSFIGVLGQKKGTSLFNMDQIRDESTLNTEIIEEWHLVEGDIPNRQKYATINVGELWPGQDYRIPVRFIVPANGKASGFHLTGAKMPKQINHDIKLNSLEKELISGGVGLVYTIVQMPNTFGQKALGDEMHKRFIETLNPHYSIQYWGWPATIMRAVTAAYAEKEHFETGKIAVTGGSKNGASPSVALIADDRITAQHANVSPIWDSPLRLCDKKAWEFLENENARFANELVNHPEKLKKANIGDHFFLGGTFGPIYNAQALKAGHSWEDIQELAEEMADYIFISRNLENLKERSVDLLFHPGTHDYVNFDIQWGGKHHPGIPVYLKANTGHGKQKGHHAGERRQENLPAFLISHFFGDTDPMLKAPRLNYETEGNKLKVFVQFETSSKAESGRIWWMFDRYPDGSAAYLMELFPHDNWKDMTCERNKSTWTCEIELPPNATYIDFFSTHGKTLLRKSTEYKTYISCPYTRLKIESIKNEK